MNIVEFNNLNFNKLFTVFDCLFNIEDIYNKYYNYLFQILFKNNYYSIHQKFYIKNNNSSISKGCIGLVNNANFCYMNSILQSFLHTPVFIKYFINLDFYNQMLDLNIDKNVFDNLCLFFLLYWNTQYFQYINVQHFNNFFDYIQKKLSEIKQNIKCQNSAHEFLGILINNFTCFSKNICIKMKEHIKNNTDHTSDIIDVNDTYINLSIEKDNDTLDNCIENYFKTTYSYKDSVITHEKQFYLNKLNNIVIFNIIRERYENKKIVYLNHNLKISLQINLDKYFDNNNTNNNYNLYSFVEYVGNGNGGHYYSYCKNIDNNWYMYNDSRVTLVTVNNILKSKNVVLLFYYKNNL
jgi:ubiquitin C-terminal hydrolase